MLKSTLEICHASFKNRDKAVQLTSYLVTYLALSFFQYFIVVFIIFVTLLVGGILGYVFKDKVQYTMRQQMTSTMSYYGLREHPHVTRAWDETQANVSTSLLLGLYFLGSTLD